MGEWRYTSTDEVEVNGQFGDPGRFTCGIHRTREWVGPRGQSGGGGEEKIDEECNCEAHQCPPISYIFKNMKKKLISVVLSKIYMSR